MMQSANQCHRSGEEYGDRSGVDGKPSEKAVQRDASIPRVNLLTHSHFNKAQLRVLHRLSSLPRRLAPIRWSGKEPVVQFVWMICLSSSTPHGTAGAFVPPATQDDRCFHS